MTEEVGSTNIEWVKNPEWAGWVEEIFKQIADTESQKSSISDRKFVGRPIPRIITED